MAIIYLTLAWVAGITLAFHIGDELPFGPIALTLALGFALVWPHDQYRQWRFLLACATFFALGGWRLEQAQPEKSSGHVANLNNEGFATIYGVVVAEPDVHDTYTNVRVKVDEVQWLGATHKMHGKVLVRLPANTQVAYGDRIMATGELRPPPTMDTFEYREKLARQGIFSYLVPTGSTILGHGQGKWHYETLLEIKRKAQGYIENALPEPQAGLLSGILLGDESGMTFEVKDAFNNTGTSHVIAISGFNMAIIASIVSSGLGKLIKSKSTVWFLSLAVVGIYTVFVGASASVVRAALMSSVLISAPLLKRKTYVPASLTFTALLMSIFDPWVLWDIGFQLSLAAVLGMALLVPSTDRMFRRFMQRGLGKKVGTPVAQWLSEPLVVGLVAQLFTLPIILFYFGRLSLVSPAVNLLIVPAQPLILFWGGAATLVSFVSPELGYALYRAAWLFLTWTTEIVRRFAALPTASVELSIPQWALISSVVGVLIIVGLNATRPPWYEQWWRYWRKHWPRLALRVVIPIIGLMFLGATAQRILRQPDGKLHVVYLDMGLSNSVLVQSPDGAVFLIDGGRFPSRLLTELGDRLPPYQRQIDILWITSDEYDDINGLVEVVRRYDVQAVISTITKSTEDSYNTLLAELTRQNVPVLPASDGWQVETGDGLQWEILAPASDDKIPQPVALRLKYGEAVFLFTNQLTHSDEELLMRQPHLVQANVYQAADHAADDSNSEAWIAAVNPQVVIVQNDPSHREAGAIGHVMAHFEGRKLFRTDRNGTIEITTDGRILKIQSTVE